MITISSDSKLFKKVKMLNLMRRIIRGLFSDRKREISHKNNKRDLFDSDTIVKILRLMNRYSLSSEHVFNGSYTPTDINFLDKLSYRLPLDVFSDLTLNELNVYINSRCQNLPELFDIFELYSITLLETPDRRALDMFFVFIQDFNELMEFKSIPFRIEFNEELNVPYIREVHSEIEKDSINNLLQILSETYYYDVNEHLTNALKSHAKGKFPECIEESYLALEKFLKVKTGNHSKDAVGNYKDLQKKEFKGIFMLDEMKTKIKYQIDTIYGIRSKIKSHSSTEKFNRKEYLEEISRYQLNEVVNVCIILDKIEKI